MPEFHPANAGGLRFDTNSRVSLWSPKLLAPALWLDAADLTTITSLSGAVSQWNDKSGNGRHVTQATAANQPTTGTVTQNGLNTISFDGSDDYMDSSAFTLSGQQWHLIVAVTGSARRTVQVSNTAASTEAVVFQNPSSSPTYRWGLYRANQAFTSTSTSSIANTAYLITANFNASASYLRVNGTQVASGTAGSSNTNAVRLGANPAFAYTAGLLCEVVIVQGNLDSQQIASWENWALAKWAVY